MKRGTMMSSMMRLLDEVRSAHLPGRSRPRCAAPGRPWPPAAGRRRRRPCGRASTARPPGWNTARSLPARWSARSARRSGCPCAARRRRACCSSAAACSGVSVPVRSVTRARAAAPATSGPGAAQSSSVSASSTRASAAEQHAARLGAQHQPDAPQTDRNLRLARTAASAAACRSRPSAAWRSPASFSTVKLGFSL